MKIEILYFKGCPSYKKAEEIIIELLKEKIIKIKPSLIEITKDMDTKKLKFRGSPTILINGNDIDSGALEYFGFGCRVYNTKKGLQPYPSKEMIEKAIDNTF